jgi:Pentapeptide repeats (8 copies)
VPINGSQGKLFDEVDTMITKNIRKEEVVWLYELGERNFKRQNFRGKSFRGEDLSGTDFSGSDIRGADFTNAVLKNASFVNVTAGLQRRQAVFLLSLLCGLAMLLGAGAGAIGSLTEGSFFAANPTNPANFTWVTPTLTIAFTIVSLTRSMSIGFSVFGLALLGATIAAVLSSAAIPFMGNIAFLIVLNALVTAATAALTPLIVAAAWAFRNLAALLVGAGFLVSFVVVLIVVATFVPSSNIAPAITIVSMVLPLTGYTSWKTLKGTHKYIITLRIAYFLSTKWGTSFRGCDLTNANFTRAILKSTDFSNATLTNTCWDKSFVPGDFIA